MTLSEELTWRGFVNQTTYKDISSIDGAPITFYWGVDPSASSMHVGQLAMAVMIRHFINHGHKAILLVGGATGMIGDPDGKNQERHLKPIDEITTNKQAIARQYETLFSGMPLRIVDNYDWFKDIGYIDFLRDIGKQFSMTQLLDREFVQSRIGKGAAGISYAEFSYSLIQGYDFLHLFREHGVTLQIAGADQWGNSVSGVNLVRKLESAEAHIWTAPLIINKTTGIKFGKSETGTIWLDPDQTSPYQFFQFWLNVNDDAVIDYLKFYTLLNKQQIESLTESVQSHPSKREAQAVLAYEVTKLVHGVDRAEQARNVTAALFGDTPFSQLIDEELDMLAKEIPVSTSSHTLNALVVTGVAKSNSDARRLIESGAVSINGKKVFEDAPLPTPSLIKKGKNSFILVR